MSLITAEHLSVSIGKQEILKDLSFVIPSGTFVGLIGPNGSGKTTLLKAIGGLYPYAGALRLKGQEVRDWKALPLAQTLAFVRQSNPIAFDFTVAELVLLGRTPHKPWLAGFGNADREQMLHALAHVGLAHFENRVMTSLSGGETQRALLAQALVQEADVLLLDEPTTHLDIHHQFAFLQVVRSLVDVGRTVIAVFHDLALAARFADRLLVLQEGQLVHKGPVSDVLTTELIADVFSMRASCVQQSDGRLSVTFHEPMPKAKSLV